MLECCFALEKDGDDGDYSWTLWETLSTRLYLLFYASCLILQLMQRIWVHAHTQEIDNMGDNECACLCNCISFWDDIPVQFKFRHIKVFIIMFIGYLIADKILKHILKGMYNFTQAKTLGLL